VEIEVPTRRICGLSARSCASLTGTTSKNGNCLHCETSQRVVRKYVDGTYSWRKGGRCCCSRFGRRRGRVHRFQGSTAHCGPEIPLSAWAPKFPHPSQPPTDEDSSLIVKHPHPLNTLMAFFGLRKWSTPVSARLCDVDYTSWSLAQFASLILTLFPFFSHRCSGRCGLSLQLAVSLTSSSPRRKTSRFAVSYFTRPKPDRKLSQLTRALFSPTL
jgi:hypothetical protein